MTANGLLSLLDARDRALFVRWSMFERASRTTRFLWRPLTHLGDTSFALAAATLPIAVGGVFAIAARQALETLVLSHLVVQLVKRTVGRPRPSRALSRRALVREPDRFSFPSGHSAAAMSVAVVYAHAFPGLAMVLIPLAVLVGASRVCLGVHFPGDVLIGQLIAVVTAIPILQH